jgi:hypothetical protein
MREIRKRIWFTIRELDLQNSFEYGLPTLLYGIKSSFEAPANLVDEVFDEASKVLPISKPVSLFTCPSYQYHGFCSWKLRLEIYRCLLRTGVYKAHGYENVLRDTHEINQAISSLRPWDAAEEKIGETSKQQLLAYAFLKFQLVECILAIHRPYLKRDNSKFWVSKNVCYQISQDILFLNSKLAGLGIQNLTLLREDLLLTSLSIVRITMLQPRGNFLLLLSRHGDRLQRATGKGVSFFSGANTRNRLKQHHSDPLRNYYSSPGAMSSTHGRKTPKLFPRRALVISHNLRRHHAAQDTLRKRNLAENEVCVRAEILGSAL